ncbi:MAG: MFS transporter, partial [Thermoanaerobaculia bacterium]|nr:MFS transporter [Thermoanaerobaculia bacterium]
AAAGPVIGGILTARVGWHAIFLVNAPILAVAAFLARRAPGVLEGSAVVGPKRRFDGLGAALLAVGLGAVAVGLKVAAWRWSLVPLGGAMLLAFTMWESRTTDPLLDLKLFRERHFVAGGAVIALQNLTMYALIFQLPFLLEGSLQLGPEKVGRVLVTMTLAMMLAAPVGARLSERIGVRRTVLLGLGAGIGGLLIGLRGLGGLSLGPLLLCLGALGLGLGLVTGPVQAAALSAVSGPRSGVASGVLSTMRYLGGIVGVSVISILLDGGGATDPVAGHRICFLIYIATHGIAILVASLLPFQPQSDGELA